MKRLMFKEQAKISSTAKVVVGILIFDRQPLLLPLAVQSQVPRCCMLPKGPLGSSDWTRTLPRTTLTVMPTVMPTVMLTVTLIVTT